MRVLVIGGTGLISTGIVKHLLARKAEVTIFTRGRRAQAPAGVKLIVGDRADLPTFEKQFRDSPYDVVIDMICFTPQEAQNDIRIFATRPRHFIFCSTVCTYGIKVPPSIFIDEMFPQEPISVYGKNKLLCENLFMAEHEKGTMNVTIVRPSHTYGEGGSLIDQLEFDPPSWDRIEKGLPILISDGGMGLWVSTHRDDCGKFFAYAAGNSKTFGQAYNATHADHFTWRDYYATVAAALGGKARMISMPDDWIIKHDASRFGGLREILRYHGAYDSAKARRDVPEFRCEISLQQGAKLTLDDVKRRGAWKKTEGDEVYEKMVKDALAIGMEAVDA